MSGAATASPAASAEVFELRAGALRLALRPDLGGSIAGLWHHGVPVLRSTEPQALERARAAASFPLVPWSNRIAHGRFVWQGHEHRLAFDRADGPHALHGVGYLARWRVEPPALPGTPAAEIVLAFEHGGDAAWPFAFAARQRLQLSPTGLRAEIEVTNTGTQPAPFGLGWHPYFPKRARSRLHVDCSGRWELGPDQLPTQLVPQAGIDGDVARLAYDNVFEGTSGPARIRDERFSLALRSSLSRLVVYTPQDRDYFAVEPVSHVSNAVNQPVPGALGLVTLQPGQTQQAWMTLDVQPTH